jgi:hypothetical protein
MNDVFSGSESLSLSQVLPRVVASLVGRIHTATVGRVDAYDVDAQTVDVTPLVNRVCDDGATVKYKKLSAVSVLFPVGADGGLTFPIKNGDIGLLIFAERSTDEVMASGQQVTPADPRRYHLSDGFFVPGIVTGRSTPRAQYADATEVSCGQVRVVLRRGKVAIGVGSVEVLKLLSDTLQALSIATTMVAGAPVPLTNAAAFADLMVQIELIRGSL